MPNKIKKKVQSFGLAPYIVMNGEYFVLLNKSSKSSFYNFFKGKIEPGENKYCTAIREFYEETGVEVNIKDLEEYFFQSNPRKDVGIFLVNWGKYHDCNFNFSKQEIWSASWVNVKEKAELSRNQQKIWDEVINYFCKKQ